MNKELELQMNIEDKLLDIVDNCDEFSRGDLQGAISAQVRIAMIKAVEIYKEELRASLAEEFEPFELEKIFN